VTTIFNQKSEKRKRRELLKNRPAPEIILWTKLKRKQLNGLRFRRQYSVNRYVVDFYCPAKRLVIEIDGDSHFTNEAQKYDEQRSTYLKALGLSVLRFTN